MTKQIIRFLILLLFIPCSCVTVDQSWDQKVQYAGALRNAMMKGDISPKFDLKNLNDKNHLYALGARGYLKGEIQILDGEPYNNFVGDQNQMVFDKTYNGDATLIVYARVPQWIEYKIPDHISSRQDFEKFLGETAQKHGIDANSAFPFLIEGSVKSISWHVINWDPKDKVHSHKKHIESGIHQTTRDLPVTMLGFYSTRHTGIFTHHTTNMHIHFLSKDKKLAGHCDDMELQAGMILKLPTL